MNNSEYKYEVRVYRTMDDVRNPGSSFEIGCDTLKEAKEKAKRALTEEEARRIESSQVFGYSQVVNRFTGECVADFFNDKICQSCGQVLATLNATDRLAHSCDKE